jgi:hypothetical protein
MSRVDDSNAERRAQEARLADRRNKERLQKERTAESSAFDQRLAQKNTQVRGEERREVEDRTEQHDLPPELDAEHAVAEKDAPAARKGRERAEGTRGAQQKTFGEKLEEKGKPAPKGPEKPDAGALARGDGRAASSRTEGDRKEAQLKKDKSFAEQGPDAKSEDLGKEIAGRGGDKKQGPVKRADDGGGKGASDEGKESGSKDQKGAAFKMPPMALMAPPPLARPKDAGGAARMSSVTKEIVEKIVSRVLVGTNEKGVPEFRIDLKSSALKGLSIKVSGGRGGKIRAVFSGSDREVLKALKQGQGGLREALAAKGLSLEEILFEDV